MGGRRWVHARRNLLAVAAAMLIGACSALVAELKGWEIWSCGSQIIVGDMIQD